MNSSTTPQTQARKELDAVLSFMVGRRLTMQETLDALGMARSTYYQARDTGRLITADNLCRAATNLRISATDLLVRYGYLTPEDVLLYAREITSRPSWSDLKPQTDTPPL